ncbi:MAG TPA: hypothetical protein DEQ02_05395 [Ruminococcaceae bacterium]|nr:hypothetical protein [Oscillospiraceae bacterium]
MNRLEQIKKITKINDELELEGMDDPQVIKAYEFLQEMQMIPCKNKQGAELVAVGDDKIFNLAGDEFPDFLSATYANTFEEELDQSAINEIISLLKVKARQGEIIDYAEEEEEESKRTQAEKLLKLTGGMGLTLFHDDYMEPFAYIPINAHREVWVTKDKNFKYFLARAYYKKFNRPLNNEALAQTVSVLESQALFDGEKISLNLRTAERDGNFYYDLCNEQWEAVRISSGKVEIDNDPGILFRRYNHQAEQVMPVPGGDIRDILNFFRVKPGCELLFLIYVVSCFIPDIPKPCLIIYGEKGAAKSTSFQLLKLLIDPSGLEMLTLPKDTGELIRTLNKHLFCPFDNVSGISAEISDELCKAVTGAGTVRRALYSNDDDIVFQYKRCLAINGINNVATRPDLLDRSVLIELERITETDRQTMGKILHDFEAARPALLGAVFDTLANAMAIRPDVNLSVHTRLADFDEWGYAIAEAVENGGGEKFLRQFRENRAAQNEAAIESHPVASCIIKLMEDQTEWKGTASELLKRVEDIAEDIRVNTKDRFFPKAGHVLVRRLKEVKSNLEEAGIHLNNLREGNEKILHFTNEKNKVSEEDIEKLLTAEEDELPY